MPPSSISTSCILWWRWLQRTTQGQGISAPLPWGKTTIFPMVLLGFVPDILLEQKNEGGGGVTGY